MAKENKQTYDGAGILAPSAADGPGPLEYFEIESLNADDLDVEELEARLEMAASITGLALYCGSDGGSCTSDGGSCTSDGGGCQTLGDPRPD